MSRSLRHGEHLETIFYLLQDQNNTHNDSFHLIKIKIANFYMIVCCLSTRISLALPSKGWTRNLQHSKNLCEWST